jgi:hypothetical protein
MAAASAGQTQSSQTVPPVQAAFTAPAAEINKGLPKWLRFSGEYRVRFEGYTGGNFKPDTTDSYMLSRLKLGLTIKPTRWLTFFAEGYDARSIAKSPAVPPFENTWDIREGYAELGSAEKGMFTLRAGRQELAYGDQRLVGSLGWANTARTFDAVKGTFHYKNFKMDAFSASVVNPVNGTWDHHLQGNNLHGLYGSIEKAIPNATIEPYVFWRLQPRVKNEAGIVANMDERVPGIRIVGKLPAAFDYGMEAVEELGILGTDRIAAYATHFVVGRTTKSVWSTPRIFAEYNFASGDKNATDGKRGTFDQLYPTGHDKYGLADQIGWRNMKDVRLGVETRPRKAVTASVVYNDWHLASASDGMYNAAGTLLFRSATGTAGTHIGQEIDVIATVTLAKPLIAGAGFGHIFPGEFLKNTTPGAPYNFPYVMFTYKF